MFLPSARRTRVENRARVFFPEYRKVRGTRDTNFEDYNFSTRANPTKLFQNFACFQTRTTRKGCNGPVLPHEGPLLEMLENPYDIPSEMSIYANLPYLPNLPLTPKRA